MYDILKPFVVLENLKKGGL